MNRIIRLGRIKRPTILSLSIKRWYADFKNHSIYSDIRGIKIEEECLDNKQVMSRILTSKKLGRKEYLVILYDNHLRRVARQYNLDMNTLIYFALSHEFAHIYCMQNSKLSNLRFQDEEKFCDSYALNKLKHRSYNTENIQRMLSTRAYEELPLPRP